MGEEITQNMGTEPTIDDNQTTEIGTEPITDDELGGMTEPTIDDELDGEIEPKPFSVDDLDFSDIYKIGNYDFNKYKEYIPEEHLPKLEEQMKKYEEKGFTQEQIEFLIEDNFENRAEPSPEEIQKDLNATLTIEEKRNYRAVGSQLKGILNNSNLGHLYETIMSNPIAYRVANVILNSKGASIGARTEIESRTSKNITGEKAVDIFNDLLAKGEMQDMKAKAKELYGMLATDEDRKFFNEIVYTNLK